MFDPREDGASGTPSAKESTLVLLREFQALQFVMHTHHPATHVPTLDAPADDSTNQRVECPDDGMVPVATIVP